MTLFYILLILFVGGILTYLGAKISKHLGHAIAFTSSTLSLYFHSILYGKLYGFTIDIGLFKLHAVAFSPLSWLIGEIVVVIGFLSILASFKEKHSDFYYLSVQFLLAGMLLFVNAYDSITLFLSLELVTLFSFFGIWDGRKESAVKYLIWNLLGAYFIVAAIAILYRFTGSYFMNEVHYLGKAQKLVLFLLLFAGFAVKSALMPFHVWVKDAYRDSPHSFTALLSGAVSKIGIFGYFLIMFYTFAKFFIGAKYLQLTLAWLGGITALFAGIYATTKDDSKELLAYSSISQLGYVVAGIALATPLSISAGAFQFVGHAIFETLLFFTIASVAYRTGTTRMTELGGLIKKMPVSFIGLLFGIIALSGIPPTVGFPGKWMLYESFIIEGRILLAAVIFTASITAFLYSFRLVYSIFLGPLPSKYEDVKEAPFNFTFPIIVLLIPLLLFGVQPGIVLYYIDRFLSIFGIGKIEHSYSYIVTSLGKFNALYVGIVFAAAFVFAFIVYLLGGRTRKVHQFDNFTAGEVVDESHKLHYVDDFYLFLEREIKGFLKLRIESLYDWLSKFVDGLGDAVRRVYSGSHGDYIVYLGFTLLLLILIYGGKLWF